MQPTNNKALFHFLINQMVKLENGELEIEKAKAQALLAKQVNSTLRYELERIQVQMRLSEHNARFRDGLNLRELEGKNFD